MEDWTLEISPLEHGEIDAACGLHPYSPELRAQLLWHFWTPYAHVNKAVLDGKIVGYGCAIGFSDSGWIRELFMYPTAADSSIARQLLLDLLRWLEGHGALRQLVIVPENAEMLYISCGFAVDGSLLAYEDGTFLQATKDEVVNMEPEHMMAVLRLDRLATGEDRERMLREHAYLGSVYQEGTRVRGFSLPLLGHGLIVADSPAVGLELQRWLLPIQPYLLLPVGHLAAHGHMMARKYTAHPAGVRMVRGIRPDYKPLMIYAHP